ncbi:hypothetical protein HVMH_0101 [Hydrogenovibrio marinus]|nr:hypothetical protein HVMH_0101 [Hydrogenovibrio marinus]
MSNHYLAKYLDGVPDFPKPGILFQDISPLLKSHFSETIDAISALFSHDEWEEIVLVKQFRTHHVYNFHIQ